MKLFAFILFVFLLSQEGYAHEGHKHSSHKKGNTTDSVTVSRSDTHKNTLREMEIINEEKKETEGPFVLNVSHEITEHLHNKIVHFTVALSIVAFLFTLANFRWKSFDSAITTLVVISAVSAIFAVFTGLNQAEAFKDDPKEWVVELHKKLGIISMFLLWLWSIMLISKPLKRYAWLAGAVIFILVSLAGFYGGIVAH